MTRALKAFEISPEILLQAYSIGLFPMAEDAASQALFWVDPEMRGIFPLDALHIAGRLAKTLRAEPYEIVADRDFEAVISACAAREKTWINAEIRKLYRELHDHGHAHSIEAYEGGRLVGGLYGVNLGAAFFGESMFHTARDASKVALVHLVARLKLGGFRLLDAQFLTPHLATLGAVEIARADYRQRLAKAVAQKAAFETWPAHEVMRGARALELCRPHLP